ncbi:EAL domain-containing protein [Noviherbaspirillum sp. ST9]|uniref:EAL domain-containing protein n=1 Tax=Noviherbaspirillum sp. ST9 TaxID=3401606 RepID=UPI003B58A5A9
MRLAYGEAAKAFPIIGIPPIHSAHEPLVDAASFDELTGLPNRKSLWPLLEDAINRIPADKQVLALLVVDVDHFSFINTSIGYDRADKLLQLLAQRLDCSVRDHGVVARHGVDEFAVVLSGIPHAREVSAAAERIARAVAGPFTIDGVNVRITCSIGISLYPQDGGDTATLVRNANLALHRAKDIGRNNLQFFARELNERVVERARLDIALRSAVENHEMHMHYQPIADLQTGKLAGLEALARWKSRELGDVSPDRFIAVAEECGLIEQLGEWAIRCACQDIRYWLDHGYGVPRVAVNVSPRQFRDPSLATIVSNAMSEFGISADMLCLEVTENVLMQDTPACEATLARLAAIGIDLVLDDFGTGYSSLGYLKRYAFRKVKIDRSFIENIVTDSDDAAIARTVISMAHSLGIRVVAEGVETEEQCEFLMKNMCDEIQGFLYAPPLAPDALREFLREGRALPGRLLRQARPSRTLLLVDDETNIVAALKRLLRPANCTILTANSGREGLEIMSRHPVDVIVSDQRMPEMTGVEFLRRAKELSPDTIRIVLSGYTELQSVTDAVNEGAIYKFLTKPWDDCQLRAHIDEAFRRKEMADENRRLDLEVRTANFDLAVANRRLEEITQQQQQQIRRDEVSLHVVREALHHVALPVIGLDEDDYIAFVNVAAQGLLCGSGTLLGCDARDVMPELLAAVGSLGQGNSGTLDLKGATYCVNCHRMGQGSEARGILVTLTREPS